MVRPVRLIIDIRNGHDMVAVARRGNSTVIPDLTLVQLSDRADFRSNISTSGLVLLT